MDPIGNSKDCQFKENKVKDKIALSFTIGDGPLAKKVQYLVL